MSDSTSPPDRQEARDALAQIGAAQRRLAAVPPPDWLYPSLAACMVVDGLSYALGEPGRTIVQMLVLAAIFALSFATQRRTGVVRRLTHLPARPRVGWMAFMAIVLAGVLLMSVAQHAGAAPLWCFVLAGLTVTVGPRLNALWRQVT